MRPTSASLLADGWRLFRADWEALTGIIGPFVFLPALAMRLLIAPQTRGLPEPPNAANPLSPVDDATAARYLAEVGDWMGNVGVWLLLSSVLLYFASLAIAYFYLAKPGHDVRQSLTSALVRLPLLLLAVVIASFPVALGYLLLIIPAFYVLGRVALVAPVVAAEPGTGPVRALLRSLAITRGFGWTMMVLVMAVMLAGLVAQLPLATLDEWMLVNAPNPIARAIIDVMIALVSAAAALAMTLVQIAAYRRLSSR